MPKVTDARDLLVHDLAVVHSTEKSVEGALPRLAREANNDELRSGLERHLEETREHIRRLEHAFELIGEKPRSAKALGFEGLELQHRAFAAEASDDVLPEVLDVVALASASATEHHEIALYESLITLAESLGVNELVDVLQQNLQDEQRMLGQVEGLAKRLGAAEVRETGEGTLTDDLARGVREIAGSSAADVDSPEREPLTAATRHPGRTDPWTEPGQADDGSESDRTSQDELDRRGDRLQRADDSG